MRGETMKDKSKKSTYSTTFGVDPISPDPELDENGLVARNFKRGERGNWTRFASP